MESSYSYAMNNSDNLFTTQVVIFDKTPGTQQKKIQIVVRDIYTIRKVFEDIKLLFNYDNFDLIFQPSNNGDLKFLNDIKDMLFYELDDFDPSIKSTLVILPAHTWDGDKKRRFDLTLNSSTLVPNLLPYPKANQNNNCNLTPTSSYFSRAAAEETPIPTQTTTTATTSSVRSNNDYNMPTETAIIGTDMLMTSTSIMTSSLHSATDSLNLSPMSDHEQLSDDDLALGASASPTETEPMTGGGLSLAHTSPINSFEKAADENDIDADGNMYLMMSRRAPMPALDLDSYDSPSSPLKEVDTDSGNSYVGLVNQAMTCYLNSLLQALYMTPEFRNALYRWEFDNDNEGKNIPYQLQKLFLNLQTSKKPSVETTDLTRSFGWDSTEAWQQHDIQELCRVMFDALEHKFKNTKQANLISNLYEGKLIDYVKCLECNTEKTRDDTFLDIPLPVRPFGSETAYGSVEEALRAFVQPETLDGSNQYFCENCNKKCDAHKGLKFKSFPYILTLHLKRFDFDYATMHRIKLNDKVTFPQVLNLNSFVNATDAETFARIQPNGYVLNGTCGGTTLDDCSTTDSGSNMEEDNCSSGIATTASSSQHENDINDDDEGIDLASVEHRPKAASSGEPYEYELFAIMIHSGSASGGHYYAYIKEFENGKWYCFNDQNVTSITQEDIQKTFGGGASRPYFSSVYSSSTNAYMLMYRQINPKRNEHAMKASEFPEHINHVLPKLKEEQELRVHRYSQRNVLMSDLSLPEVQKARVFMYHPKLMKLKSTRVFVSQTFDINMVLQTAYKQLDVEQFAPLSHCRLVAFEQSTEDILQSFEDETDPSLTQVRAEADGTLDYLLEFRKENQIFEKYEKGGRTWSVYEINIQKNEIDGPLLVHTNELDSDLTLKRSIAIRLHMNENELILATLPQNKAFVAHDPAPTKEAQNLLQTFATQRLRSLMHFFLHVPNTDPISLEIAGIPPFKLSSPAVEVSVDEIDAALLHPATIGDHSSTNIQTSCSQLNETFRESPLPPNTAPGTTESNSEDSSLSDGDRTLVEPLQNRGGGDSQQSSNSYSPQMSSPDDESARESYNRINAFFSNPASHYSEYDSISSHNIPKFFYALEMENVDEDQLAVTTTTTSTNTNKEEDATQRPGRTFKIFVDNKMKVGELKKHLETVLRVPANCFKLSRKHETSESLPPTQSLLYVSEGELLNIALGKTLIPNERKARICFMRLSELKDDSGKLPVLCEWIYHIAMTVTEAKKELVAKLHRMDESKYGTLNLENCRLWVMGGRNPVRILYDNDALSDSTSTITEQFLVQECENVQPQRLNDNGLTIFVRQYHPDKLQLDNFQEITLQRGDELRNVLGNLANIEETQIGYCNATSQQNFPCTNFSLVTMNTALNWYTIPAPLDKYPLSTTTDGSVFFFKDLSKEIKELSSEERRSMMTKEKIRLDRLGGGSSTSTYSPRRERALKIYLDSPQSSSSTNSGAITSKYDI